jgi:hypothetical protein
MSHGSFVIHASRIEAANHGNDKMLCHILAQDEKDKMVRAMLIIIMYARSSMTS